jgi:gluconate 2-dehydrogenase gamma chain
MTADNSELELFSRRSVLKSLATTAVAGSVLRAIPLEAAEQAHHMVAKEKAAHAGVYKPKFFTAQQYETLQQLCETIIPADAESGGAIEAGAPEFIDLVTSENPTFQYKLGGGLLWLDSTCTDRYGAVYTACTPTQQKEMLDLIAFRKSTAQDPSLAPAIDFFAFLRTLTADGFFTSEIGIKYLGYVGNTYVMDWQGCPPVPGL